MKPDNIMLDLETLSTKSNALIVSIGAVTFCKDKVHEKFYKAIRMSCYEDYPAGSFHISPQTVAWWMGQSDEAREVFKDQGAVEIEDALEQFYDFVSRATTGARNVKMWGNGASFDNPILSSAYGACGLEVPWRFYNDRCYRTVKNMCPLVTLDRRGTYHNALDDALTQAEHLIEINKYEMEAIDA